MALKRASELDEYFAKNKKTVGPLHGLPISLKDQLRIKVIFSSNILDDVSNDARALKPPWATQLGWASMMRKIRF
jgi:Asp-tRNA(Asn)/Glu-tRNA(Gln) amidotransferase A subunit family amidase